MEADMKTYGEAEKVINAIVAFCVGPTHEVAYTRYTGGLLAGGSHSVYVRPWLPSVASGEGKLLGTFGSDYEAVKFIADQGFRVDRPTSSGVRRVRS